MSRRVGGQLGQVGTWPVVATTVLLGCGRFGFDAGGPGDGSLDDPYAVRVLASGPIAYWRLGDTGALAIDATGRGHHGTLVGGVGRASSLLASSPDGSMMFDGISGHITVPDHPELKLTTTLTLEGWIRAEAFDHPEGNMFPRIVNKGFNQTDGYVLAAARIQAKAFPRIELDGVSTFVFNGATMMSTDTTYHVAATYDGTQIRVYLDGVLDASMIATGATTSDGSALVIGQRPDGGRSWKGQLDEIAIYDRALDGDELLAHFNAAR